MASSIIGSLLFALDGLWHALQTELNLKLFLCAYVLSLVVCAFFEITSIEWTILLFAGGTFLTIELLNTALERFSDAFDSHSKRQDDIHFAAIKATKDVAAGAALVSGMTWVASMAVIFWPYAVKMMTA